MQRDKSCAYFNCGQLSRRGSSVVSVSLCDSVGKEWDLICKTCVIHVVNQGAYIAVEGVSSVCSGLCFSNDDRFLLVLDSGARVVMQFRIPE